jgi:pimeloyl-ACP methyl ester carboxylesterase
VDETSTDDAVAVADTLDADTDRKTTDHETMNRETPDPLIPWRPRTRRTLRRLRRIAATAFILLTMLSVPYNAYTDETVAPPPNLTFVQADGIKTRYEQWGSTNTAATTPIVLVHGAFEQSETWQPLATHLAAQGDHVYALDLTGSGYSARVAPYSPRHLAAQLTGFVDALGIAKPILVAHSSGAAVAAEAVLESPNRYSGLMFLDGDGLPIPHTSAVALLGPLRTSALRLGLRSDWLIRTIYAAQCGPSCPRLDAAGVERFRRPYQVSGAEAGLWTMLSTYGGPGLPASRLAQLTGVCLPKAVTFGAQDSVFTPDAPRSVATMIGAPAPTVIDGAHHLSLVSNPVQAAATVEALANGVAASGCR